jgi:hypothetical protein
LQGKELPHNATEEECVEFWRLWNAWWKLRTAPDPQYHQYPRRKKDALARFTELFELRAIAIQEAILKKQF